MSVEKKKVNLLLSYYIFLCFLFFLFLCRKSPLLFDFCFQFIDFNSLYWWFLCLWDKLNSNLFLFCREIDLQRLKWTNETQLFIICILGEDFDLTKEKRSDLTDVEKQGRGVLRELHTHYFLLLLLLLVLHFLFDYFWAKCKLNTYVKWTQNWAKL